MGGILRVPQGQNESFLCIFKFERLSKRTRGSCITTFGHYTIYLWKCQWDVSAFIIYFS